MSEEKKQQVLALGRLGWPLRRIEQATGVRRETASAYLRAAGVPVRPPRGWGHAKPAKEVITDPVDGSNPAKGVITDLPVWPARCRSPAASACEPYRELIEHGLSLRRNAMAIWQELVDRHGFTAGYPSVMRFARKLRGVVAKN